MMARLRARLTRAPAEGWLSLFFVAILAVTVAWSLDDAALVLGRGDWTDFLAWVALAGVAAGFVGARVGWNRPVAHLVGAAFAGLIVPVLVGSVLDVQGTLAERYSAAAWAMVNAVIDFAVRGLPVTRETGHYLLFLGLLCWANGQFAASAVFRHGRPIGPIIVLGAVLVANMSATEHEQQIWFLVLFSVASLALLTRLHALEERATWIRRRIGDPNVVGGLYLRGGTVFIIAAVFLALTLTASARSAPLAGFWEDAKPTLVEISQWLQRIIPAAPDSRTLGVPSFGAQVSIGGIWSTTNTPALEIVRPPGDKQKLYWRATTYDTFTLSGWTTSIPTSEDRPANIPILGGTLDAIPTSSARTVMKFTVIPQTSLLHVAFSPIDPVSIDQPTTLNLTGTDGFFQSIGIDKDATYTLTAAIPTELDIPGGLTMNRLRAAGTNYPPGITARYLAVPVDAMGPAAGKLLADLQARDKAAGRTTPYDLAKSIVDEFHNTSKYSYQTNVLGVCGDEPSIVECFADHKRGYCEHFASTMTILLRKAGIPARLVEGFLPGDLDPATGHEEIRTSGSHAWVEVYFPGYGWEMFDPTGGDISQAEPLPEGSVVPLATVGPRPSFAGGADDGRNPNEGSSRPRGAGAIGGSGGSNGPGMIVVAVLLFVAVLALAFLAWRRGPRGATNPDAVYASVIGIARRFGFGPRPTQTAYEYATALADVLPSVRPELQTVAAAKVEVAYGRRTLGEDRLSALRTSYRRLRVALLRLAFRRRDRGRMRRG